MMPRADEGGSSGAPTPPIVGSAPDTTFRDVRVIGFLVALPSEPENATRVPDLLRHTGCQQEAARDPGEAPRGVEEALNETIVDNIRQSALPNTLAFVGVVIVSFVINLLVLMAVTGG